MRHLPAIHKSTVQSKPTGPHGKAKNTQWAAFVAMFADPDFVIVVTFCTIGLLIVLILRFPDYGAVIDQYNQF
jgi:hypothetical protein